MDRKHIKAADISRSTETIAWTKVLALAAVLTVITIAAYWRVGQNGFLNYDDDVYVTDNRQVQQGLSLESVKWAFGSARANNWHPLTWLSLMLDRELFGTNPAGPHLVNLGIHTASALLLFAFLAYTTRRTWMSWFVAALFAVHPLHVESVAWIAERKDVLSTFFWMATICMYAAYIRKPGVPRYLAVAVLLALGLMSKPMVVTLPLVLLLLDYWPLERLEMKWRSVGRLALEKLPLLLLSAASCLVTVMAQSDAINKVDIVTAPARLANALTSCGIYLAQMFWPAGLAAFYPRDRVPLYWQAWVVGAILIAATVFFVRLGRKEKYLAVGWLWYLITLVPVIGLVQVGSQAHADRYTYIPLVGPFVMIAWAVGRQVGKRAVARDIATVFAGGALVILGIMTFRTVGYWKDSESLCRRAIQVTRNNYLMRTNLALTLIEKGRLDEAKQQMDDAMAIRPASPHVLGAMGTVLLRQKRYDEALGYLLASLGAKPNQTELHINIAATYLSLSRPADALPYARRATELDPRSALGFLQLSIALNDTGRFKEAAAALARSKELRGGRSW